MNARSMIFVTFALATSTTLAQTMGGATGAEGEAATSAEQDAAGVGAGTADAAAQAPRTFTALDGNGDGRLSLDEVRSHAELRGQFSELDRDRDGRLSNAEFSALESGARDRSRQKRSDPAR